MLDALIMAAISLVWLVVMFVPLERAFPAHPQPFVREGFATDLLFFFGQYLLFAGVASTLLATAVDWAHPWLPDVVAGGFATLPFWLQSAMVLLLGDLMAYWGHRAQHRFGFLWRFHSVHHTTIEVDWLAAHREHPLDGVYTQAMVNLPAVLLGFGVHEVMALVVFRSIWAVFIHSNVRLPLGPLKYVVGSPALHHWHHARDRDVGNYANLAPWIDLVFGTYYLPADEPESMGLDEAHPTDYLGLLAAPFDPRDVHEPAVNQQV